MTAAVQVMRRGKVLEVTLNRPKANAIDAATSRHLGEVFTGFRDDPDLLVAIFTGAGDRIFSAGWDLKAATERGEHEGTDYGAGGFAGLTELFDLDKPVIAAVNGVAVGGGVEIALACDLIVAASHVTFSLPETGLGVAADAGGLQRLLRKLPANVAMEMLLTGRKLPMAEARHFGLVNRVVKPEQLMDEARTLADEIAAGAPLAVRAIKEVVKGIDRMSAPEAFRAMRTDRFPVYRQMLRSEDHEEGLRAFAEKRRPIWKGR